MWKANKRMYTNRRPAFQFGRYGFLGRWIRSQRPFPVAVGDPCLAPMRRDFEIKDGTYLSQPPHELDLHNNFDFCGLHYSVEHRTLSLHWRRSTGDWVADDIPASVSLEFQEVTEFRFLPRDAELPFTEDDCVSYFGYWTDEAWAGGEVFMPDPTKAPDPRWLTGIHFMSGATIAVQASSAHAQIPA